MTPVVRFAPSPTGLLHLGHAFSARFALEAGRGLMQLRLDDIDQSRCRLEFETAIFEDLDWLGIEWRKPFTRSSDALADHAAALESLRTAGFVYPCFLTRREVAEASASAPHGPLGPRIEGRLPRTPPEEAQRRMDSGEPFAWRLDSQAALAAYPSLTWMDRKLGLQAVSAETTDDLVIGRHDRPTSYHLSVVIDDAREGITLVTRGRDLIPSTATHRLLQALLELVEPNYHHHALVVDSRGHRLSKREAGTTIRSLREEGWTPDQIWARVDQQIEQAE